MASNITHQQLQQLPFYQQLSSTGQQRLEQGVRYASCNSADIVLRQGQKASGAYMVLSGRLRVYSISQDGNEATLYTIEPGETCVLALNCLFNDLLYPAWVEAEVNTDVAIIPGRTYRNLFSQEPSLQDLTVHALSTLVFRLMGELGQVHSMTHRQRLANFLLIRASEQGELNITQQQLAHHLGTRREVIARLLLEFVAEKLIITGRGKIKLLNTELLREISLS